MHKFDIGKEITRDGDRVARCQRLITAPGRYGAACRAFLCYTAPFEEIHASSLQLFLGELDTLMDRTVSRVEATCRSTGTRHECIGIVVRHDPRPDSPPFAVLDINVCLRAGTALRGGARVAGAHACTLSEVAADFDAYYKHLEAETVRTETRMQSNPDYGIGAIDSVMDIVREYAGLPAHTARSTRRQIRFGRNS